MRSAPGRRVRSAALLLAGLVCGCGDGGSDPAAASHPWVRAPTNAAEEWFPIAPWMVYRVTPERVEEAAAEIAAVSYVQISPGMASHYAGQDVRMPAAARPFLVRGLDAGGSEITVMQSSTALWVRVSAGEGQPPRPQPLLVLLDPTPVGLYVTLGD